MKNENWFLDNDRLKEEFVKNNIENNEYYEYIREQYNKNKEDTIRDILYCYDDIYQSYYSLYTIMDSIEDYARENKLQDIDIDTIINAEDFMLRDY